jgi:nitrate reductase gamma subunit
MTLLAAGGTILWIWMIIDCATQEPSESNDKIVWLLVILLTHVVGALIYYFRQEAGAEGRVRALMAFQTVIFLCISYRFPFAHRARGGSPTAERESYCSERRME